MTIVRCAAAVKESVNEIIKYNFSSVGELTYLQHSLLKPFVTLYHFFIYQKGKLDTDIKKGEANKKAHLNTSPQEKVSQKERDKCLETF